ncbi:hypothetical protein [Methanobrevibacter sp.]|uniref:hypothetical protein n=1 Tax=Methanobrevibacter sp. TaxID=66852 RepID=UPI003866EFF9
MNYKKIVLVGFISAFVAVLTSVLGVAGTVIGSVISSVLYNTLSEALEKPVANASFKKSNFEWDVAYVFPLIVIAIIQLMLVFALLAEQGILPANFLKFYLSLQHIASNNLYRILGLALIVMSAYPFVLKPDHVNKIQGGIIAFVGLIFLARGFVDLGNSVTDIYDSAFIYFDFEIAIFALVLLAIVIIRILLATNKSDDGLEIISNDDKTFNHKVYYQKPGGGTKRQNARKGKPKRTFKPDINNAKGHSGDSSHKFKSKIDDVLDTPKSGINESSENIRFESNDLLDDFKK